MQTPTIGRIVLYILTALDAERILDQRARSEGRAQGNYVQAGQAYPMVIVRIWGDEPGSGVNGKVLLDGNDSLWVTSVHADPAKAPGTFYWWATAPAALPQARLEERANVAFTAVPTAELCDLAATARALCRLIEEIPGSPEQTAASVAAANLGSALASYLRG